jgi:hypothetical protein
MKSFCLHLEEISVRVGILLVRLFHLFHLLQLASH